MPQLRTDRRVFIAAYVVGAVVLASGWHLLAPRGACVVDQGQCVFFGEDSSSVFFFQDAVFAGVSLVIGIAFGIIFRQRWWLQGISWQLQGALAAILAAVGAMLLGEFINPIQLTDDPRVGTGQLLLRTTGAIFMWAMAQQVTHVIRGVESTN